MISIIGSIIGLGVGAIGGVSLAGCGGAPPEKRCSGMSAHGPIADAAQLLTVKVYPPSVVCAAPASPAPATSGDGGIAQPIATMSFPKGAPITLALPPGPHTVILTAFADAAGALQIGTACSPADFQPGQKVCLDLALTAACPSGKIDCDGMLETGCECATDPAAPACCAHGCQTEHQNGFGGFYYDCGPVGMPGVAPTTYSPTMANEAAASYAGQAGTLVSGMCGTAPDQKFAICKTDNKADPTMGTCTCWVYDASGAKTETDTIGHVHQSTGMAPDIGCKCSSIADPLWN